MYEKKKQANRQTLLEEFQYSIEKLLNGKIDTIRIQIHDRSLSRLVTSMSKKWWVKLVLEAQTHKRDNSSPTIFITVVPLIRLKVFWIGVNFEENHLYDIEIVKDITCAKPRNLALSDIQLITPDKTSALI